jgi:hypothetical protein
VFLFDPRSLSRLRHKRITQWAAALLALLIWAMIVRMFNSPIDTSDYLVFRAFGLQLNNIGFLLSCVVIFDDPIVLKYTKQAIVVATLASIALIVSELLFGSLHFTGISGRGAGLYVQPNSAGMAIVFGCLIGLKTIRRPWPKDFFVIACLVGVLATFSRQAVISLAIILTAARLGRALPLRRIVVVGLIGAALFAANSLAISLAGKDILTSDTKARLSLDWSDSSTMDRARLAYKTWESFEDSPLLGQGFGTTEYWADEPAHNAYLTFMVDCGVLGALVIPGLVLSVRRHTWDSKAFTVMFLVWGLVSHLVLTELFALMTIAVLADEPRGAYSNLPHPFTENEWNDGYIQGNAYAGSEADHGIVLGSRAGIPD